MQYVIEDEYIIDLDLQLRKLPEVDMELVLPVITMSNEEIPVVTPLQVLDYGTSSIEVSFTATTESAEEVVKGVLCGTENPPTFENADYRLLHGEGSIDLVMAGLHNNTEYYLRPYALSNLGYKYGDVVSQRTKASPIPEDLQLIEYFVQDGVSSQIVLYQRDGWNHKVFDLKVTKQDRNLMGASLNLWWGADRSGYWVTNNGGSTKQYLNIRQIVERNTVSGTLYVDNMYIGTTGGVDEGFLFLIGYNAPFWCNFYKLEGYTDSLKTDMTHNCYPVRSLDGSAVGLYDLITNERTMVSSSIWQPGPDKDWDE